MKKLGFLVVLLVIGLSALTSVTCHAVSPPSAIISVKDFGAVGDGATDDTTACQNAVSAANSSGKTVQFPAGTYILNGTLTCSTEICGSGEASVLKFKDGAYAGGTHALIMLHTGGYVHDLAIDGNASKNSTSDTSRPGGMIVCAQDRTRVENIYMHDAPTYGISVYNASDCIIHGCRVINSNRDAIEMIDSTQSNIRSRFTISDCVVDTASGGGIVWWGDDAAKTPPLSWISKIAISNCQVRNVPSGGIWGSCGKDITVTGCTVDTAHDVCIDFEGCQNCTASGNTVREGFNSGFYALYGCRNIVYSGNTIYCCDAPDAPGQGIEIGDSGNDTITIVGNSIYGSQGTTQAVITRGIYVDDTHYYATDSYRQENIQIANNIVRDATINCLLPQYVSITNNRVYLTTHNTKEASGIELDGCPDCIIEGNAVIRTTPDSNVDTFCGGIFLRTGNMTPGIHNGSLSQTGAIRNIVRNNYVSGFTNSIVDRGSTAPDSADADQLIVGNVVSGAILISNMSTSSTAHTESNGSTEANRLLRNIGMLVTPTTL